MTNYTITPERQIQWAIVSLFESHNFCECKIADMFMMQEEEVLEIIKKDKIERESFTLALS